MANEDSHQGKRLQLGQEVLELGEELFELALGLQGQAVADQEMGVEVQELREAKEEFFTALRLLLGGGTGGMTF